MAGAINIYYIPIQEIFGMLNQIWSNLYISYIPFN